MLDLNDPDSTKYGISVLSVDTLVKSPKLMLVAAKALFDADLPHLPDVEDLWKVFQNLLAFMVEDNEFDHQDLYSYPASVEIGYIEPSDGDGHFYMALDNGYHMRVEVEVQEDGVDAEDIFAQVESHTETDPKEAIRLSTKAVSRLPKSLTSCPNHAHLQLQRPLSPSAADNEGVITVPLIDTKQGVVAAHVHYNTNTDRFKWIVDTEYMKLS